MSDEAYKAANRSISDLNCTVDLPHLASVDSKRRWIDAVSGDVLNRPRRLETLSKPVGVLLQRVRLTGCSREAGIDITRSSSRFTVGTDVLYELSVASKLEPVVGSRRNGNVLAP